MEGTSVRRLSNFIKGSSKFSGWVDGKSTFRYIFPAILHFVGNLDEELAAIDQLLSDETLLKLIAADLSQRYPHTTQTGRNSTLFRGYCTDVGSQALTLNQLLQNN
jgi:hypothetical protein